MCEANDQTNLHVRMLTCKGNEFTCEPKPLHKTAQVNPRRPELGSESSIHNLKSRSQREFSARRNAKSQMSARERVLEDGGRADAAPRACMSVPRCTGFGRAVRGAGERSTSKPGQVGDAACGVEDTRVDRGGPMEAACDGERPLRALWNAQGGKASDNGDIPHNLPPVRRGSETTTTAAGYDSECGTCDHEWPPGALRTQIVVIRDQLLSGEGAGDEERPSTGNGVVRCAWRWYYGPRAYGRSCADGSPGRQRRVEVIGRGVRRGNGGDASNGERAGEGGEDTPKRARGSVTVGVRPRWRRRRGGLAPALRMRVVVLVVIRAARRAWSSSDMTSSVCWCGVESGKLVGLGEAKAHMGDVAVHPGRSLIQRRRESGGIGLESHACRSGTVGRRCLVWRDERRAEMVEQSTVKKGYIERLEGLELQYYYEGDRIETHTRTDVGWLWIREEMAWLC
ncbi:hypothetical protein B0H13DRAFT_2414167 [Mycena leptocephala]|nr:hypothetical protein B0H13DRAFT_2414167 [Mycena leptocephala]